MTASEEVKRSCGKCGKKIARVDPCLGVLPGVESACCGHGIRKNAYIKFTNGVMIREFVLHEESNESSDT